MKIFHSVDKSGVNIFNINISMSTRRMLFTVPDPHLEIRGGEPVSKNFFRLFEPQFGLKIGGAGGAGSATGLFKDSLLLIV